MPPSLVLASTSAYRRELLDRLKISYRAVGHLVDEGAIRVSGSAVEAARELAVAKAESLVESHGDAYLLASDQIVEVDGEFLGKPGNRANARQQLERLSQKAHRLVTAVALRSPDGDMIVETVTIELTMRQLASEEIDRYLDAEQPWDCAGSYKIESLGISLFDRVEGQDFTSIVGLPLTVVARMLRDVGFLIP